MRLRVDGSILDVNEPFVPVSFSGDARVECELIDGPVRVFNLMVLHGAHAHVPRFEYQPQTGDTLVQTNEPS